MKRTFTLKKLGLFVALLSFGYAEMRGQAITESFNDITLLTGNGWAMTNASVAVGTTNWFQGTAVPTGPFDAFSGAANAYIGANYNNTGSTGTISNWLMTPNRTFRNGDVITFYTRKPTGTDYPDRLEVRMSTNGASTNVGSGTTVGDYTMLLLSINPTLVTGVYPTAWTQYTITVSGLSAPTSGRIAFRYFVTSAGLNGTNSDYIGIDEFTYTPYVCPAFTMTAGGALTDGTAGSAYTTSLTQTGALGTPTYAVTAGALPPGLTLSASGTISGTPTATGTFNFTATVSDASGCSGSQSYSITTVCPANPITVSFSDVCSNASPVTLSSASPAGGTYSGAGVSGGMFDPAAGTQTITYDYTDAYGCSHQSSASITVNTPTSVSLSSLAAVCIGSADVTLAGGAPAGGTYSGTNVTGGVFSPIAAGTTDVIYTYTDANGCVEDDTTSMVVNDLPVVTIGSLTAVCIGSADVTLAGGAPTGGTYSGTNVTGGLFSPIAAGTSDVIYTYTDANGCTEDDTTTMVVNGLPVVSMGSLTAVCEGSADVTLAGGSPIGGAYTGTNVAGGLFSPVAAGTTDVIYTFTDANGCSEDDTTSMVVNAKPTVTQTALSNVCVNSGDVALTGGSPAGGSYTGTNVSAGNFSPIVIGTSNVTYTYADANACVDSAVVAITVDPCVGIAENNFINEVRYFPNPNNGQFTLTFNQIENSDLFVSIKDIQGKEVASDKRLSFTGNYSNKFDLSSLAKGVYTLEIKSGNRSAYYKIVSQ